MANPLNTEEDEEQGNEENIKTGKMIQSGENKKASKVIQTDGNIINGISERTTDDNSCKNTKCDRDPKNKNTVKALKKVAIGAACMVGGAGVAIAAVPAMVTAIGFTTGFTTGITTGSLAASAMSAAWTSGFGVGAIATLQSIGAVGLGAGGTTINYIVGAAGAGIGKGVHEAVSKIHNIVTKDRDKTYTENEKSKL